MRARTILTFLIPLLAAAALFVGCNQNGTGIFYTLNTEEKQTGGDFPKANQVVEADSGIVYIRTGNSIRQLNNGSWNIVKKYNVDTIAAYNGTLYAMIDESITPGGTNSAYIQEWNNTTESWSTITGTNTTLDANMFTIDASAGSNDSYLVVKRDGSTFSAEETSDFGTFNTVTLPDSNAIPVDAAYRDGDGYYLITKELDSDDNTVTKLYTGGSIDGSMSEVANIDGNLLSITAAEIGGTDYVFFTTYAPANNVSRVYAYEGTTLTSISNNSIIESDNTNVAASPESIRVVSISGTQYLIIGSANGYYECDLSTDPTPSNWNIQRPSDATADITDSSSFDAKYPDLNVSYVFSVLESSTADVFYLGVGKESGAILGGLWRRNADGTFEKL